jgi:hypothetical protein
MLRRRGAGERAAIERASRSEKGVSSRNPNATPQMRLQKNRAQGAPGCLRTTKDVRYLENFVVETIFSQRGLRSPRYSESDSVLSLDFESIEQFRV